MSPNQDAGIRRAPEPAAAAWSDAQLLTRIAQKDRDAFDAFFERHHRHAYNLALRITRQAVAAEEAVQEAMLRVWFRARTFQADGYALGWLLRIVARESVRRMRAGLRLGGGGTSCSVVDTSGPAPEQERSEELGRLRSEVDRLPVLDQRILALYYAAGLSQQDVGAALGLSQRTVSRKVTSLLEALRLRLGDGGRAAGGMAQFGALLAGILCSGAQPLAGGGAALLRALDRRGAASPDGAILRLRRGLVPDAPPAALLGAFLLALVACSLALLGLSGMAVGPDSALPSAAVLRGHSGLGASGPVQGAPGALRPRSWSFADRDWLEELLRLGPWAWAKSRHTGGKVLCTPLGCSGVLLLPGRIPPAPFEVRLSWKGMAEGGIGVRAAWRRGLEALPCFHLCPPQAFTLGNVRNLKTLRLVFVGTRIALFAVAPGLDLRANPLAQPGPGDPAARIMQAWEFGGPYPADQIALILGNVMLSEIALQPLEPGLIAEWNRQIEGFFSGKDLRVERIPAQNLELLAATPYRY